jgi:hypothetical protein
MSDTKSEQNLKAGNQEAKRTFSSYFVDKATQETTVLFKVVSWLFLFLFGVAAVVKQIYFAK